ncbi:MAG: AEC family transporter [Candidatus Peregrinibacteria bacterium]|nr:AEC family transporter [Candidatus Peregrinibacteria bacterium]
MEVAFLLFGKLIPLYLMVALGFVAGRFLHASRETVAVLLIYIIGPVVIFHGAVTTDMTWSLLSFPLILYAVCVTLCGIFYMIGSRIWSDATKNILAFTAGSGNTGYFGLPVALALFGEEALGIMVVGLLGFLLYETTVGFFVVARGHYTVRESLLKVTRLPTLYGFALGVLLHTLQVPLGEVYQSFALNFRGAYSVLGMMMVGIGLSGIKSLKIDVPFVALAFLAKFIAWPTVVLLIVAFDRAVLHLYAPEVHRVMILLAIVPMAANTVAFASALHAHPDKAATAVFLSTIVALFSIPVMVSVFL